VENLLNPDVIRAAASSTLGILSLMCLILGIVALAFFKGAPIRARSIVFAILFIGVAGFGYAILNQRSSPSVPELTQQFVSGRWQVERGVSPN
jgi:Na+/phosphate symporter